MSPPRRTAPDPDFTTKTGAWCIKQAGEYAGRPIGELHFMDEGLGPLLSKWLAGKSVLDLGAGREPQTHTRRRRN